MITADDLKALGFTHDTSWNKRRRGASPAGWFGLGRFRVALPEDDGAIVRLYAFAERNGKTGEAARAAGFLEWQADFDGAPRAFVYAAIKAAIS